MDNGKSYHPLTRFRVNDDVGRCEFIRQVLFVSVNYTGDGFATFYRRTSDSVFCG